MNKCPWEGSFIDLEKHLREECWFHPVGGPLRGSFRGLRGFGGLRDHAEKDFPLEPTDTSLATTEKLRHKQILSIGKKDQCNSIALFVPEELVGYMTSPEAFRITGNIPNNTTKVPIVFKPYQSTNEDMKVNTTITFQIQQ